MQVPKPGQEFAGRYRVERLLAQGGFGAVFVAEQLATELRVALKVLWPHVLASKDAVDKFQLEARVAARVNSEYIVKVLDAGFDEATGLPFLVMELLEGESLDRHVAAHGPLAPAEAYRYLAQVAHGLDRAHGYVDREGRARPIIHRDLKPENLFLTRRETGEPIVKILDFGIAKVLGSTSGVSQEVKGTPLYMAHEQASGGAMSAKTDVWALGLITFYLLAGKVYWRSASKPDSTITALFGELLSLPIDPPSMRLSELGGVVPWPPAFDAWFLRCVNRNPDERFTSAGAAIAALGTALGVSQPVVLPPSVAAPVSAFERTVLSASPAAAPAQTGGAMSVTGGTAPGAPRRGKALIAGVVALVAAVGVALAFSRRSVPEEPRAEPHASTTTVTAAPAEPTGLPAPPAVVPVPATGLPTATSATEPAIVAVSSAAPDASAPLAVASPSAAPVPAPRVAPQRDRPRSAVEKTPAPGPVAAAPAPAAVPAAQPAKKDVYGER